MAVPGQILSAKGQWRGNSLLHLSWLPPEERISESLSTLNVDTDAKDAFATITYTWGDGHEGSLLVCGDAETKAMQLAWVDSWHQNTGVLYLVGEEAADGSVKAKGTYPAGDEFWGWTIEVRLDGESLVVVMENVTPAGEAEWAVRATYQRAV